MESLQSLLLRKRYLEFFHFFCVATKNPCMRESRCTGRFTKRELKVIVLNKNIHHVSCFSSSSSSLNRHHSRFLRNVAVSTTTSFQVRHQIKIPYSKQQQHPQSITTTTTNRTITNLQSHHMVT